MNLAEYVSMDATALAALVRSGDVTAAELLELARRRADEVDGALNSIVVRMDDVADERVERTVDGPFDGVPFLLKDLMQEYKGYPSSQGSRSLAQRIDDEHSLVTQRFLDSGLVVFGKTNTPELGAKGVTESDYWGPCRNPWDTGRTPGGSSGGAAAAVASGIVPAAGASDGGGSIRIPSSCTGLVGLKLSRGLSPYGPQTGEPLFGMAVQGVVTRTVRDSAALYDSIIAPDPIAAYSVAMPSISFVEQISRPPGRLRIGFSASSAITPNPHPEAVAAMESAAALLADLGHDVEPVDPPYDDEAMSRDFLTIWFAQLYCQVADIKSRYGARDRDFEADTLAVAELGRCTGMLAPMLALENTKNYIRSLTRFHDRYDFFMTPTLATLPPEIGSTITSAPLQHAARLIAKVRGGKVMALSGYLDDIVADNLGWTPYTQLANLTGRPAVNVPLHRTPDGIPMGVQFVGRLDADGELLRLAAELESARPWISSYPVTKSFTNDRHAGPIPAVRVPRA